MLGLRLENSFRNHPPNKVIHFTPFHVLSNRKSTFWLSGEASLASPPLTSLPAKQSHFLLLSTMKKNRKNILMTTRINFKRNIFFRYELRVANIAKSKTPSSSSLLHFRYPTEWFMSQECLLSAILKSSGGLEFLRRFSRQLFWLEIEIVFRATDQQRLAVIDNAKNSSKAFESYSWHIRKTFQMSFGWTSEKN